MQTWFQKYGIVPRSNPFAKDFFVLANSSSLFSELQRVLSPDSDGLIRTYATVDAAIGACTASRGDMIHVAPGHTETIAAAAGFTADVAGVTIVGYGSGQSVPIFTFTTSTSADVNVDAANVTLRNLAFVCNIANQTLMVDVNATACTIENCTFTDGSASALTMIDINGGAANACDSFKIRNCTFRSLGGFNTADRAIELGEVADGGIIEGCDIDGDFDDAGIHNPTGKILTNLTIRNNRVRNVQSGQHAIELVSACTGQSYGNRLSTDSLQTAYDAGSLSSIDDKWNTLNAGDAAEPRQLFGDSTYSSVAAYAYSNPLLGLKVTKSAANLPATTTQSIFTVANGRVLITRLTGEVTTVVQAQACNLKVTSAPTTGTAVDLASNLDINADEAGTLYLVEGDGTALVGANAGAALSAVGMNPIEVPEGTIRIETSATNTGATKWEIWYIPLDVGASITSA